MKPTRLDTKALREKREQAAWQRRVQEWQAEASRNNIDALLQRGRALRQAPTFIQNPGPGQGDQALTHPWWKIWA